MRVAADHQRGYAVTTAHSVQQYDPALGYVVGCTWRVPGRYYPVPVMHAVAAVHAVVLRTLAALTPLITCRPHACRHGLPTSPVIWLSTPGVCLGCRHRGSVLQGLPALQGRAAGLPPCPHACRLLMRLRSLPNCTHARHRRGLVCGLDRHRMQRGLVLRSSHWGGHAGLLWRGAAAERGRAHRRRHSRRRGAAGGWQRLARRGAMRCRCGLRRPGAGQACCE